MTSYIMGVTSRLTRHKAISAGTSPMTPFFCSPLVSILPLVSPTITSMKVSISCPSWSSRSQEYLHRIENQISPISQEANPTSF